MLYKDAFKMLDYVGGNSIECPGSCVSDLKDIGLLDVRRLPRFFPHLFGRNYADVGMNLGARLTPDGESRLDSLRLSGLWQSDFSYDDDLVASWQKTIDVMLTDPQQISLRHVPLIPVAVINNWSDSAVKEMLRYCAFSEAEPYFRSLVLEDKCLTTVGNKRWVKEDEYWEDVDCYFHPGESTGKNKVHVDVYAAEIHRRYPVRELAKMGLELIGADIGGIITEESVEEDVTESHIVEFRGRAHCDNR